MEESETQKKLGIYFAAINIASIIAGTIITVSIGLKEGLIGFTASLIILTILVQSYAGKKLEDSG